MTRICFRTDPEIFSLFHLAEKLSKTVHELLFGEVVPLSSLESRLWRAYWVVYREFEEEAEKNASKKNKTKTGLDGMEGSELELPHMLGQNI